jgi:hypothetical protein
MTKHPRHHQNVRWYRAFSPYYEIQAAREAGSLMDHRFAGLMTGIMICIISTAALIATGQITLW